MSMCNVTVKLFATLQQGRFDVVEQAFESGTSIRDIMQTFNLAEREVAIIFVNHRHAEPDDVIQNQDVISFFPPIGGG